jgi:hypothetical protein
MQVLTDTKWQYLHVYQSWADLLDNMKTAKSEWTASRSSRKTKGYTGDRWSGTANWAEALEQATNGWPQGRKKMKSGMVVAARKVSNSIVHALTLELGGNYPCVPAYLAGAPEHMVDLGNQSIAARPVLKIIVDCCAPYDVHENHLFNHGIAVLSAVHELEKQGYSVEVSVVCGVANYRLRGQKEKLVGFRAVFKKAGAKLDLDRAAFAIASPSVLRRFFFCMVEQHKDLEVLAGSYGGCRYAQSYGKDMYKGALILPPPDSYDCRTIEGALERVTKGLREMDVKVNWAIDHKAQA